VTVGLTDPQLATRSEPSRISANNLWLKDMFPSLPPHERQLIVKKERSDR
jgi:hypothetical protein